MAHIQLPDFRGDAYGHEPVKRLLEYSTIRLREQEKTRRLLIGAVVLLVLVAVGATLFAPPGREAVGYGISAVLIVLALAAGGAARYRFKSPGIELAAESEIRTSIPPRTKPRSGGGGSSVAS